MPARTPATTRRTPQRAAAWSRLADEDLLQTRFCDLQLKLPGSTLERRLQRLYGELDRRGIPFRPHMWLAEEWFSPDGVPGIAVPFYLAHPRLQRLERRMMKQVEGGNDNWMMRILRHEAGHAVDTAYRLRQRARWREVFGPASLPYPDKYKARPGSRRYVHHLGDWYAQSHPTEDFAETFAVWLKPNSDWRRSYACWPAWRKLRFVDEIMREVGQGRPAVRSRRHIEPLQSNRRTLAQHYAEKLARQRAWRSSAADDLLQRVFTARPRRATALRAGAFLRVHKTTLIASVMRSSDADRYSVYQALRIAIARTNHLGLRLRGSQRSALPHARWLLGGFVRLLGQGESPQLNL
jgi:Putative zinc-binding metallo-peptidase